MSLSRFALAAAALFVAGSAASAAEYWVFFGTYTGKGEQDSKGIYRAKFDDKTGKLSDLEPAAAMESPSFLAIHPSGKFLYAVGEGQGKEGGPVVAFALDAKHGTITKLNQATSGGAGPCHVSVHPKGTHAIVANYGGGSTTVFRLDDGKIGDRTAFVQHQGKGKVAGRQDAPHAHCAFFDPFGKRAMTADLGIDSLKLFAFDAEKGTLDDEKEKDVSTPPGSGPRHFALAAKGEYAYVCGELDSTVNVVQFGTKGGGVIQSISTLPEPVKGNSTAECILSSNGRYVYVSNRGHHSIAVFKVGMDHKLTAAGHITGDIKIPRNFNIDPSGKWMLIASQDGGKVGVWELDPATGGGKQTGNSVKISKCVCVKFVPVEK